MASLKGSTRISIERKPEEVFDFVADPANLSRWVPGIESATPPGVLSKGSRYDVKYRYGRKVHDITMEVTEHDRPNRLAFKTVEGPYPIAGTYELTATGSGTDFTYTQEAFSDGAITSIMFTMFRGLLKGPVRKQLAKGSEALKAALEG